MKKSNHLYFSFCILLLSTFLFTNPIISQTLIFDFEAPATSDAFANGIGFDGCVIDGVVADPVNPSNNVLSMTKGISTQIWAGIKTQMTPNIIDLTTDHEICVDFYEPDATGTLLIKLEDPSNGGPIWEQQVNTTMGWNTYCVNTNSGANAAGFIYETFVIFPDFGTCCTDQTYYLDNVYVNPVLCDLILTPGTATCNANTAGTDTYDATISFNQAAAPGAGTYTMTTISGGTIGGDDPNLLATGTITLTAVDEGTLADIALTSTTCNLNSSVASPACVPSYVITYEVDMCEQIFLGNFDPATQAVFVTGGNANQTGFYGDCGAAMTDANTDGIYDISQTYPDGYQIDYKFYIGLPSDANTGNCTATFEPNLPAPCGFGQFGDRQHIVSGMDETLTTVCYTSCTACTTCNCDLLLQAGIGTCDAITDGTIDTYVATFTFSQTTAPGAGTYTLTTTSGGTVGGDDPNLLASGTITITGIPEGTDADLNVSDGAGCNLDQLLASPYCETCVTFFDFETPNTTSTFGIFGGTSSQGVVTDPMNAQNMVYQISKDPDAAVWAGVVNETLVHFDLTVHDQICLDFYEADAAGGTLRVKLEEDPQNAATNWEYDFVTTQGWNTYCVDANTPTVIAPNTIVAAGNIYKKIVIFPDFGAMGPTPPDPAEVYYFDNVLIKIPSTCAASYTLTANETGVADYESSGNISSTSIIESTAVVDYDSATDIDLNPGFEVILGAVFEAFIDGCNGGMGGSN